MKNSTLASADGTPLNFVRWDIDSPKAQVLLVGGLAEHMGRYVHVAAALNAAGYAVAGVELRGHGHSGGKRGHVDGWDQYQEDVRAALDETGPAFIVSHSMGGLVTTYTVANDATNIRGWAMTNPLFGIRFEPPRWKIAASKLLNKVLPSLSLANELDTSQLSRDPKVVAAYEADNLVFGTITPRWYMSSLAAQEQVQAAAGSIKLPLLCLIGDSDPITDPDEAMRFYDSCGSESKTLKRWPELIHELFNEPEKDEVIAEVVAWLDAHV